MIRIHNSLTGQKETLRPIKPGEIRMYLCGDTVYDFCHIGHARSKVAFDVVRRYLMHRGYRVIFVRNITDIDDKIIRRAAELGEPIDVFTARFIAAQVRRARTRLPAVVEGAFRLLAAIAALPLEQRVVLGLATGDGLPHAEIAAILGVPEGTVGSRLHSARSNLKQRLGLEN